MKILTGTGILIALSLLLCLIVSAAVCADERIVFQCDFDEVAEQGGGEGKVVPGFEASRSSSVRMKARRLGDLKSRPRNSRIGSSN